MSQTQKANPETFKLKQDVVHSRVGVTGQQHAKPTGVQNTNLNKVFTVKRGVLKASVLQRSDHFRLRLRATRVQMVVVLPVPGIPTISV